jgi:hypothetical protein
MPNAVVSESFGIVEGGVGAAVGIVEEPVGGIADEVSPDDQTRAVDAVRLGAVGGQRIVEGGVGAAVGIVDEPVRARVVDVPPDDQTRAVDAECVGPARA